MRIRLLVPAPMISRALATGIAGALLLLGSCQVVGAEIGTRVPGLATTPEPIEQRATLLLGSADGALELGAFPHEPGRAGHRRAHRPTGLLRR